MVRAATRLDGPGVCRVVADHVAADGVVATWEQLCVPALVALGADVSDAAIAAEHVASWAISAVLQSVDGPATVGLQPAVLLACAPEERHVLPLDALRAALAANGIAVRMLGQDVPTAALSTAIGRLRPSVLVVWAQTTRSGRAGALPAAPDPRTVVLPLGPGWAGHTSPAAGAASPSLSAAVAVIEDLVARL
jgi:hypothetical protein